MAGIWKFTGWFGILALICACARGTEVGNGNRADQTAGEQREGASPVAENDSAYQPWLDWLLAPCGSPLRGIASQSLLGAGEELVIERQGEQRRLQYQSLTLLVEPVDPRDPENYQIIILDQQGEVLTDDYASRYECGSVEQITGGKQMAIKKDQVEATLRWYQAPDQQFISRIEWQLSSGQTQTLQGKAP